MPKLCGLLLATSLAVAPAASASAGAPSSSSASSIDVGVGLRGSRASMRRQHEIARDRNFTFLRTARQVWAFADKDRLERLNGNANYVVERVSFPYARPTVRLFIERLAEQYRDATGELLVVTSLTRPTSMQPRNASKLSVHPAGIAVDLRIPRNTTSRRWLERALLDLERDGVLDVTLERRPPHYHVAVFPEEYDAHVLKLTGGVASPAVMTVASLPALEMVLPEMPAVIEPATAASLSPNGSSIPFLSVAISLMVLGIFGVAKTFQNRRRSV